MTVTEQKLETRTRILAVNRSHNVRETVERGLGERFDLQQVGDADSGWQILMKDPAVRAVVINLSELELDGYNLVQLIRSSRITRIRDLPVIVMSTTGHEHTDVLMQSLRAAEFISLDMGAEELISRLDALLHPSRPAKPAEPVRPVPEARVTLAPEPKPEPESKPEPVRLAPDASKPQHSSLAKESQMSRLDNLKRVLKNLQSQSPGVEASALISEDGLMIASALSQDLDDTRVAGMTATLLNLGTRAATELRRGDVKEVIVRGEEGYAVMINAGRGALLLVLASEATPLGLIFFDMREAIKFIKNIL